jgi:uroporphyrinogen-III decarboxylase
MPLNDRERFLAVARGETPDYIPIFGFSGAPGMSWGCMANTHDKLVESGMPAHIGGRYALGGPKEVESWYKYWGTTGPISLDFGVAGGAKGFKETRRIEDGHEIIESENGAITRQVIDNDITYSMPEFIRYPVRDRESWEFLVSRSNATEFMPPDEIEANCRRFDDRNRPLVVGAGGTYSQIRGLMGTENASITLMEDPELVHEMIAHQLNGIRDHVFPLIERLKPEIVAMGEDLCYNHGMLLSPAMFEDYYADYYREVCDMAHSVDAIVAVDTDGNAMEFTDVAAGCGVDAIYPYEVKAGNDLFAIREKHPEFILFGGLEKETINEGNEDDIEPEIMSKVPRLLESRRYFPNGDHGIQPFATFDNLRTFMTILHEVCGNPEGEFPRV